ncbi:MAG: pseudouridine synthase [Candidatus Babeliales bacterium]
MYLAKYLAHAGLCSRRKAIELVKSGQISVNNIIITDPAYLVKTSDKVKYENKIIRLKQQQVFKYILLNKPKGYVSTVNDEKGRRTVLDLIKLKKAERIYPVGRLDKDTTGLILLTNDGDLAQKLSHPRNEIIKAYHVITDKDVELKDLATLSKGVRLEDGFIKSDDIFFTNNFSRKKITVKIHSGKKRIIRRMFQILGYEVEKLDRFLYAGLTKKDLPIGGWRFLTKGELKKLKNL